MVGPGWYSYVKSLFAFGCVPFRSYDPNVKNGVCSLKRCAYRHREQYGPTSYVSITPPQPPLPIQSVEETHGIATFTQVLVLYHEMMDESQMTDYFARIFHPIPVLAVMGRSALADPPVKKETAVFYNWRVAGESTRHAVAYFAFNRVLHTLSK